MFLNIASAYENPKKIEIPADLVSDRNQYHCLISTEDTIIMLCETPLGFYLLKYNLLDLKSKPKRINMDGADINLLNSSSYVDREFSKVLRVFYVIYNFNSMGEGYFYYYGKSNNIIRCKIDQDFKLNRQAIVSFNADWAKATSCGLLRYDRSAGNVILLENEEKSIYKAIRGCSPEDFKYNDIDGTISLKKDLKLWYINGQRKAERITLENRLKDHKVYAFSKDCSKFLLVKHCYDSCEDFWLYSQGKYTQVKQPQTFFFMKGNICIDPNQLGHALIGENKEFWSFDFEEEKFIKLKIPNIKNIPIGRYASSEIFPEYNTAIIGDYIYLGEGEKWVKKDKLLPGLNKDSKDIFHLDLENTNVVYTDGKGCFFQYQFDNKK